MLLQDSNTISVWYIRYRKLITFIRISFILQLFFLLTIFLFCFFAFRIFNKNNGIFIIDALLSMFFFSLIITTQLDAYSRYQNYKMVKDMFYQNGFRGLIIKPFIKSQCQRDAVKEAAYQLNLHNQVKKFFYDSGYRWYHIIPSVLVENPFLLLTRNYWITTFFVPKYKSKYFLW